MLVSAIIIQYFHCIVLKQSHWDSFSYAMYKHVDMTPKRAGWLPVPPCKHIHDLKAKSTTFLTRLVHLPLAQAPELGKVKWTGTSTLSCFSIVLTHNANSAAPCLQLKGIWFNMEHTLIQEHSQSPSKSIQALSFWLRTPSTPVLLSELGSSQSDQDFSFIAVLCQKTFRTSNDQKSVDTVSLHILTHSFVCMHKYMPVCAHKHPLNSLLYPENWI